MPRPSIAACNASAEIVYDQLPRDSNVKCASAFLEFPSIEPP